jgi:hypothetical protein
MPAGIDLSFPQAAQAERSWPRLLLHDVYDPERSRATPAFWRTTPAPRIRRRHAKRVAGLRQCFGSCVSSCLHSSSVGDSTAASPERTLVKQSMHSACPQHRVGHEYPCRHAASATDSPGPTSSSIPAGSMRTKGTVSIYRGQSTAGLCKGNRARHATEPVELKVVVGELPLQGVFVGAAQSTSRRSAFNHVTHRNAAP